MTGRGRGNKGPIKDPVPGTSKKGGGENNKDGKTNKPKRPNPFRGGFRGFRGRGRGNPFEPIEKPITMALPKEEVHENRDVVEINTPYTTLSLGFFGTEKYPYFKLYFINTEFDEASPLAAQILAFEKYFERNFESFRPDIEKIKDECAFDLNYETLLEDQEFMRDFANFEHHLKKNPDKTLATAGMAMRRMVSLNVKETEIDLENYRPRIIGYKPITNVSNATDHQNIDSLISVRGTVMRLSEVKYRDLWMDYKCLVCGESQLVRQNNGRKVVPKSCKKKGCRNGSKFDYIHDSPYRVYEPVQKIRLKENIHENTSNNMRCLNVLIKYELVDILEAGDDIVVTGILRVPSTEDEPYLDAVSISERNTGFTTRRLDFLDKDLQAIELIRTQPSVLRLLVNSLNPDLYGMEMVKAGLILSLFSGSPSKDEEFDENERGNIHILMVGDPGMGKSELMNACCTVAPKAIYSISSHMSGAGLTGSIKRTKGVYTLDAGALVLAHGGICCIDEIDKKEKVTQELLDVMERQKVSILKMATKVDLACRTTIIAAGNPVGNEYKKSKTVAENIKLHPALLTRFDLIFIILKQEHRYPGEDRDSFKKRSHPLTQRAESFLGKKEFPLADFLYLDPEESFEPLPHLLFQNYIAFARTHVFPKMTEPALEKLVQFYIELRRKQEILEFFDITTRQFQALRRLCIARARVDLADEVTIEHVNDVIELTRYSLIDIFTTEAGELETRGVQGSGMSKAKQKMLLLETMKKFRDDKGQNIFNMDQLKKMKEYLKLTEDVHDTIDSLNIQGFVLLVKPGVYKLI